MEKCVFENSFKINNSSDDFKSVINKGQFYVDKTLFIKEFFKNESQVTLITRPRRFGKTMLMTMLKAFFEKNEEDPPEGYFKDLSIYSVDNGKYREHMGHYPVVFLTFGGTKGDDRDTCYSAICNKISEEFSRHLELLDSDRCNEVEKKQFNRIWGGKGSQTDVESSLKLLTCMLYKHYKVKPIVLLDEYDTPLNDANDKGYFNSIITFFKNMFINVFKTNEYLGYGFITGCLKIAKQSLFSDLNNPDVCTLLNPRYSDYFGFTEEEVLSICKDTGNEDKYSEIQSWYDGYNFSGKSIYNPYSVINYFANGCTPDVYWIRTGGNAILNDLLSSSDKNTIENLYTLSEGGTVKSTITPDVVYSDLKKDSSLSFSVLLMSGYLKVVNKERTQNDEDVYTLSIPNREIKRIFKSEVIGKVNEATNMSYDRLSISLVNGDIDGVLDEINDYLRGLGSSSFNGYSYQGMMFGMLRQLEKVYDITNDYDDDSDGRADIMLLPKGGVESAFPPICINIKSSNSKKGISFPTLIKEAFLQADEMEYLRTFKNKGYKRAYLFGFAFKGRNVQGRMEEREL